MYLEGEWVLDGDEVIQKGVEYQKASECEYDRKLLSDIKKQKAHESKSNVEAHSDSKRHGSSSEPVLVRSIHQSISCKSPHHESIE